MRGYIKLERDRIGIAGTVIPAYHGSAGDWR
jgi:hypothetical protein